jgi:hypothetical protein
MCRPGLAGAQCARFGPIDHEFALTEKPVAVLFDGLVALPWNQEGRSGIAFRADAIRASGAPLAGVVAGPKAASTGTPGSTGKPAA